MKVARAVVDHILTACGIPPGSHGSLIDYLSFCALRSPDLPYAYLLAVTDSQSFAPIPFEDCPPVGVCVFKSDALSRMAEDDPEFRSLLSVYGLPVPAESEMEVVSVGEDSRTVERVRFETVFAMVFKGKKTGNLYPILVVSYDPERRVLMPAPPGIYERLVKAYDSCGRISGLTSP